MEEKNAKVSERVNMDQDDYRAIECSKLNYQRQARDHLPGLPELAWRPVASAKLTSAIRYTCEVSYLNVYGSHERHRTKHTLYHFIFQRACHTPYFKILNLGLVSTVKICIHWKENDNLLESWIELKNRKKRALTERGPLEQPVPHSGHRVAQLRRDRYTEKCCFNLCHTERIGATHKCVTRKNLSHMHIFCGRHFSCMSTGKFGPRKSPRHTGGKIARIQSSVT